MFEIDANGIVHVSARDLATGKEQSIQITASSGLTQGEIDKMIRESEIYEEDDSKKKKIAELRNNLDGLIYTTSKALEEYGDYFSAEEYNQIIQDLEQAQEILEEQIEDYDYMRKIYQSLEQSSYQIAEAMYTIASQSQETDAYDNADDDYEGEEGEEYDLSYEETEG
jgi:molecular chaperone DnaK